MFTSPAVRGALSIAAVCVLAGCAAPTPQPAGPASRPAAAVRQPMTPGMTMPDGSIMGTPPTGAAAAGARAPSAAAAIICSAEFRHDLAEALAVRSVPAGARTFVNSTLSCSYPLFGGHLVLTVKDLPDPTATSAYLAVRRRALRGAHPLDGLTPGAVGNGSNLVVLRKDTHVLTVDTSAMPAVFGSQHNKRGNFAYEVAAVVLGCWTGS